MAQTPIDEIPPNGWWSLHSRNEFQNAYEVLLHYGMDRDTAIELLSRVFAATAHEYGD